MKVLLKSVVLAAMVLLVPKGAAALPFTSAAGLEGLGSFTGSIVYDSLLSQLQISLTNTSPLANGGLITAFAFNNPGNLITDATMTSTDADFGVIGGAGAADFQNDISVSPYGSADVGTSLGTSWLGSGSPNAGIGVGNSATFTFAFTGTGLGALTVADFVNALPTSSNNASQWLLVRFRGFVNGGSDKVGSLIVEDHDGDIDPDGDLEEDDVVEHVAPVPEPATFLLFGAGAVVLAARRMRASK